MACTRAKVILMVAALGAASCGRPEPEHAPRTTMAQMDRAQIRSPQRTDRAEAQQKRGFVGNIETITEQNDDFRRVLYTAKHSQLVVMSIPPGEHIGAEVHDDGDQFLRVEHGSGEVIIDGQRSPIGPDTAIVIPAGARHDVINTGSDALKLYTIYSPPEHRDGVVHRTRMDAEKSEEHFDGKTTEQ